MKKTLFICFVGICTMINSQDKKELIVDELLTLTKVKESLPLVVDSVLMTFKQQRHDIPENYWEEIKNNLMKDASLLIEARKLYNDNYTTLELEELLFAFKERKFEVYNRMSSRIESQLYQLGNNFGKKAVKVIVKKIKEYH